MMNYVSITMYSVEVIHKVPSWKQFDEFDIQEAFPTFKLGLRILFQQKSLDHSQADGISNGEKELCNLSFSIEGHYYCSGSQNFEIEEVNLDDYSIDDSISKEKIAKLLNENKTLKKKIQNKLKGSLIEDCIENLIECLRNLD